MSGEWSAGETQRKVEVLEHTIYGNGSPGLKSKVLLMETDIALVKGFMEEMRDEAKRARHMLQGALLTALVTLGAVLLRWWLGGG